VKCPGWDNTTCVSYGWQSAYPGGQSCCGFVLQFDSFRARYQLCYRNTCGLHGTCLFIFWASRKACTPQQHHVWCDVLYEQPCPSKEAIGQQACTWQPVCLGSCVGHGPLCLAWHPACLPLSSDRVTRHKKCVWVCLCGCTSTACRVAWQHVMVVPASSRPQVCCCSWCWQL
jgi:hypothetical protein